MPDEVVSSGRARAQTLWEAYLTGERAHLGPMVLGVRRFFSLLPSDPRCRVCLAPFGGPGWAVSKLTGFGPGSTLNPSLCIRCEHLVKEHQVGYELEVTMMFADVRGSTTLAQELGPQRFHRLIDRFYRAGVEALVASDALIEKLIGDEVAGIYVPGIAGPDCAQRAFLGAQHLLELTGHRDPGGPWVPVGAGVHTGRAYVGAVGSNQSMSVITVLGDAANTAARLASSAGPGEILVSVDSCARGAAVDGDEARSLALKGRAEPLDVRVHRVGPA
jgi:adenylate cyclase